MNTCTSPKKNFKKSYNNMKKIIVINPLRVTQFGAKALDDTEKTPT